MEQSNRAAKESSSDLLAIIQDASVSVDHSSAAARNAFAELAMLLHRLNTDVDATRKAMKLNAETQRQLWDEYDVRMKDTQELLFSVRSMLQTLTTILRWMFVELPQRLRSVVRRVTVMGPCLYFVGSLASGRALSLYESLGWLIKPKRRFCIC